MHKKFAVFASSTVGLIILDQLVKVWARNAAQLVEGRTFLTVIPNVFEFKLVYNEGVAFGMFQGGGIFLTPIAILITGFTLFYSWKAKKEPLVNHLVLALLASGAVGNLIDRIVAGKVTDMFFIRAINFPVFNVADICITLAGVAFVLAALKEMLTKKPKLSQESETPSPATSENLTE